MDPADYNHPAGMMPTTFGGPYFIPGYEASYEDGLEDGEIREDSQKAKHTGGNHQPDPHTTRGDLSNWYRMDKADFKNNIGTICRVPVAALAYTSRSDNVISGLGEISMKDRFIVPVMLHENHMDVLVIYTSSGSGGTRLSNAKRETCVGFTKEGLHDYVNVLPNLPVQVPENNNYPAMRGAYTDVTFTHPVAYDSRIRLIDTLPDEETDYLMDLFEFFRAEELRRCNPRFIDLEFLEKERERYENQKRIASKNEADRKMRRTLAIQAEEHDRRLQQDIDQVSAAFLSSSCSIERRWLT
jgi:hypothetical protein